MIAIGALEERWPGFDFLDTGVSKEAHELRRRVPDLSDSTGAYFDFKKTLLFKQLSNAISEAAIGDWGDHHGHSVDPSSLAYALQFINYLKASVPIPEIAIDSDGDVALEWGSGPRNNLSVRIGRGGMISFSALQGYEPIFGTAYFVDEIPENVSYSMRRTFNAFPNGN